MDFPLAPRSLTPNGAALRLWGSCSYRPCTRFGRRGGCCGLDDIRLHVFTDVLDTDPQGGVDYLGKLIDTYNRIVVRCVSYRAILCYG